MKITIGQITHILDALRKLYKKDRDFPVMWDIKMRNNILCFEPVKDVLVGKEPKEQQNLWEKEIDLPLSPLKLEDFPKDVPAGTITAFAPIIEDYEFEPPNINIEELLNGTEKETNGQSKNEAESQAESKD